MIDPMTLAVIALVIAGISIACTGVVYMKLRTATQGTSGENLQAILTSNAKELAEAREDYKACMAYAQTLDKRFADSVQQVSVVRFNPFDDAGGDNSFALALLNQDGDGVVMSSLYAREKTSVYAKPVTGYTSTHQLSDEEKQAITTARS